MTREKSGGLGGSLIAHQWLNPGRTFHEIRMYSWKNSSPNKGLDF